MVDGKRMSDDLKFETCPRCGEVFADYSWYILGRKRTEHYSVCTGETGTTTQRDLYGNNPKPTYPNGGDKMGFKEIGSAKDTWGGTGTKIGSIVTGKLVEVSENANSTDGSIVDYILDSGKEGRIRVWGSAILCRRLGTDIEKHQYLGKRISITYKGKVKAKHGMAHDYKVEVEE